MATEPTLNKKNLVVLADGTWNDKSKHGLTNICKMNVYLKNHHSEIMEHCPDDSCQQHVLYQPGVGTSGYLPKRTFDGATGNGIVDDVLQLYWKICKHFQGGEEGKPETADQLFLFGFSRGATAVRILSSMIGDMSLVKPEFLEEGGNTKETTFWGRMATNGANSLLNAVGWLNEKNVDKVQEAFRLFSALKPDEEAKRVFREKYCYKDVKIRFLGVFDTVAAIFGERMFAGDLHYQNLHPDIEVARHAVALNEHRRPFNVTLWDCTLTPNVDSEQRWFPGCHSDIGGSYQHHGLSDCALVWMLHEAKVAGLHFSEDVMHVTPGHEYESDGDSDLEEFLEPFEIAELKRRQYLVRPNALGKMHDSRTSATTAKDHTDRKRFWREVGRFPDETLDASVALRAHDLKRFPPYAIPICGANREEKIEQMLGHGKDAEALKEHRKRESSGLGSVELRDDLDVDPDD